MRSTKKIKPIEEIVKPYSFVPQVDIEGGVNGISFRFKKGVLTELTPEQYEAILHSDYGKYLT